MRADLADRIATALRHIPPHHPLAVWLASSDALPTGLCLTSTALPQWLASPYQVPPGTPVDQLVPVSMHTMSVMMRVPMAWLVIACRRYPYLYPQATLVVGRHIPDQQAWLMTRPTLTQVLSCMRDDECHQTTKTPSQPTIAQPDCAIIADHAHPEAR